ncbi:MAG: hypothetical protein U0354_05780 [Candidatus Sericytochromatia bacterium]
MSNNSEILSEKLSDFVEKYFIKMEFKDMFSIRDNEVTDILSEIEKTLVKLLENNYDENDSALWLNREICMRSLVILTHMDYFAEIMERNGYLERGLMLYSRILDNFSQKILEDPEIVQAIKEDRLEEEIERRFAQERETNKNPRTSNFLSTPVEEKDLEGVPEDFQEIPEKF